MDHNNLIHLVESDEILLLESMLKTVITPSLHFNEAWLKGGGRVAVPVESACHFNDSDAYRLAKAIKTEGCLELFALPVENYRNSFRYLKLATTQMALQEFNRECAHFNYLLIPRSLAFAILCTVYDYFVLAGTVTFVETAIGDTLGKAQDNFTDFAMTSNDTGRLAEVAKYYCKASEPHIAPELPVKE